ncbi:MAG: hypothetical protein BZ136_07330 [Methanosphaera sp. rholeuAM74]|nr:MAG: hypothetical protein BZ136_07330 [Methanosphaera sp. rholeuAM74]
MTDFLTKMDSNNKIEIPEEIIKKFQISDKSTIEWTIGRNKDIILNIRPYKVKLAPNDGFE